jgi:hypothetical protein
MKRSASSPRRINELDPVLDAENLEFDFSGAPRPGRNGLFERAQGHFREVSYEDDARQAKASALAVEAQHKTRPRPR